MDIHDRGGLPSILSQEGGQAGKPLLQKSKTFSGSFEATYVAPQEGRDSAEHSIEVTHRTFWEKVASKINSNWGKGTTHSIKIHADWIRGGAGSEIAHDHDKLSQRIGEIFSKSLSEAKGVGKKLVEKFSGNLRAENQPFMEKEESERTIHAAEEWCLARVGIMNEQAASGRDPSLSQPSFVNEMVKSIRAHQVSHQAEGKPLKPITTFLEAGKVLFSKELKDYIDDVPFPFKQGEDNLMYEKLAEKFVGLPAREKRFTVDVPTLAARLKEIDEAIQKDVAPKA